MARPLNYSDASQTTRPRTHINLSKINIKSFGGDPLEWLILYIKLTRLLTSILDWQNVTRLRIKFLAVLNKWRHLSFFFHRRAWCTTSSIFWRISNSVGPVGIKKGMIVVYELFENEDLWYICHQTRNFRLLMK